MELPESRRGEFVANGFFSLPSAVPADLVEKLRAEVQEAEFGVQHKNAGSLRKDKRFKKLEELSNPMRTLYGDYVRPVGDFLLAETNMFTDAQYSVMEAGRPASAGWHIDGTWRATDKNSLEGIPFFKLLVGVYLTDLTEPEHGNFMISPSGHKAVESFFKTSGPEICEDAKRAYEGLYAHPVPDLVQVLASPGDMIAAHSMLPHSISRNDGPDRPVIYFRLGAYKQSGYAAFSDLWHEWPESMRETQS